MDGEDGGGSLMDFIEDPLRNVNIAYCSLPDLAMEAALSGGGVSATVTLAPHDAALWPVSPSTPNPKPSTLNPIP